MNTRGGRSEFLEAFFSLFIQKVAIYSSAFIPIAIYSLAIYSRRHLFRRHLFLAIYSGAIHSSLFNGSSEQINAQAGIVGSLDASLHLYKTVCRSVSPSILSSRFREYQ